ISKVMLTMESRIHGDMYVRFGGRLAETYHRKVEKRCRPSLLKEIADICGIQKRLTTHVARHTAATVVFLANEVSMENVAKILGHSNIRMTQHYAKVLDTSILRDMGNVERNFSKRQI
ncbi:tyrosine-type recombinase/integrase, partial [Bacteroides salyersiae]|uniref:tyrosine-type recombinase/integrase n=1 Tax=Bacteroides salyersiae TaxID=291644 RepID=UPI0021AB7FF2